MCVCNSFGQGVAGRTHDMFFSKIQFSKYLLSSFIPNLASELLVEAAVGRKCWVGDVLGEQGETPFVSVLLCLSQCPGGLPEAVWCPLEPACHGAGGLERLCTEPGLF